eukprot:15440944-Alexandrium_andersonii.AAC.1
MDVQLQPRWASECLATNIWPCLPAQSVRLASGVQALMAFATPDHRIRDSRTRSEDSVPSTRGIPPLDQPKKAVALAGLRRTGRVVLLRCHARRC